MTSSRLFPSVLGLLASLALALPQPASACAACFGISDSPLAKGMNWGILTLLVVVVGVLAGIATAGVYFVRRAARNPLPLPADSPTELTEKA